MSYLARRIALGCLTIWLITLATFVLLRAAPGDAVTAIVASSPGEGGLASADADQLRRELGLDRAWPVQYADWLAGALSFDPGRSLATGRRVADEIEPRLAVTAELAAIALTLTVMLGLAGGLAGARYDRSLAGRITGTTALLAISTPQFWLALVLVVAVASWTGHFLALGYQPFVESPSANLGSMLPAAAVLAIRPAGVLARVVRRSTLEASGSQHFLLARARGTSRFKAITRHAFRTALLPSLTVIAAQGVFMLGGAVVIEQVFGLPGLGRLLVSSVLSRDFPVVEALVLLFGVTAVGINLLVDFAYVRIDPRLRVAA